MHETRREARGHHRRHAGHPHHHHDEEGFGPFPGRHARFGAGQWFGPPPWAGRRRRGDVRFAVLAVLAEQPMHGYDLIRELEERSGGMWRPSAGSVYPTLQMLEDEGLVTAVEQDGKRVFSLTDTGRAEITARKERSGGAAPWEMGGSREGFVELRDAVFQLGAATMQVARAGKSEQVARAAGILAEARKKLYAILSED